MLSGGAGLGKYHHGVIRALHDQDLLPNVICGSSAGSIFASCLSTLKRDEIDIANTFEFTYAHNVIGW
jgi:predicted acylesterase/phospholipase RssA